MKMPIVHCAVCEAPFVLRVNILTMEYVFMPDCKHKSRAILADAIVAPDAATLGAL